MNRNNTFLFSIDLEDVRENVANGFSFKDRVIDTTNLYLDWLQKNNFTCTFFTVGKIAERYPDLIKHIVNCGHEIACHSYDHTPIDKLGKEGFKFDLDKNINALLKAGAIDIKGFRAPIFSLTKKTEWAYDVLSEFNFIYSSSVLPAKNPLYGWEDFGDSPKKMNDSILEIPITLSKFINIKVPIAGGVYFRVLPKFFVLNEVKKNIKSNTPILSYFHPYDVDTEQEKFMHSGINDSKFYNWLMYYNRKNVFNRLDNLLELGLKITTYKNYLNSHF